MTLKFYCSFGCGTEVDPESRYAWREVHGWERRSSPTGTRRGGSDISMRKPTGKVACDGCIQRLKAGLSPQQGSLI